MSSFTLHELQCFDAVVRSGSFQAAAQLMHRSHPSIFTAVAKLEAHLGISLLDRSGYRVQLTDAGRAFHAKARALLQDADGLHTYATQLAMGDEAEIRIALGDLCPLTPMLKYLGDFFAGYPQTRLHLMFETITGPWERLRDGDADLIIHRVAKGDADLEWIDLGRIALVPVAAPGFFPSDAIAGGQLKRYTQCVIRDSARNPPQQEHYIVDAAPRCSVPDHFMKRELIMQGMAWGHVPRFLIDADLREGRLVSLANRRYPGVIEELVVARRRDRPQGPVAMRLWQWFERQPPRLPLAYGRVQQPARGRGRGQSS